MNEKDLKNERCGCKNNNNKDQDSCSQDIKKGDENCCKTNCCKDQNKVVNIYVYLQILKIIKEELKKKRKIFLYSLSN